ncbi:cell wall protein [Bacillus pseudomycoides]|uniref:Cell wall protein n=1 Tax=Bacillus pseudomycoides TaxID=64104 RepID=A0AA91V9I2_9BACI|nr:LPXTG cell wall anchor domain-containing protein [Bacillus sp. AFS014408]PEB50241.1 cell wall protein [Bacillus sp. AFS098217]PED81091.1 cell wall protein [Bacillus pseudomycoides]PEU18243.1 cell wall protein [Bacillus sp. AFS014408]
MNKESNTSTNTEINKESNTSTNTEINKESNTSTNNDSKVPPTKENDKTIALLPKTGGTPTEFISILVGMLLLVFGVFLFGRQRG